MRSSSVRTRLSLFAALVATIGLACAATIAYIATSRALDREVDQSFQSSPVAAADGVLSLPPADSFCGNSKSDLPSLGLYSSQLVRPDGSTCEATGAELVLPDDPGQLAAEPGVIVIRDGEFLSGAAARVAEIRLIDDSVVVVGRDLSPIEDILKTLRIALLGVVVLGGVASWFFSRWAVGAGLRPVTRFVEYAEVVAAAGSLRGTDLPAPPPAPTGRAGDELTRLSGALEKMMLSLSQAQERLHQLVTDAGHELRTPLSSVRNNVALLRRSRRLERPLDPEEERQLLADLEEQTVELAGLVDDLVQLTATDEAQPPSETVRFDQSVERAIERARLRGRNHQIRSSLEPWVVEGDDAALERATVNLIDNAIKFSEPGTIVEIQLRNGTLTVADQGSGVSSEHAAHAFERFWRAPAARAKPGSGLGLAMVAEIARIHGGWADLAARAPQGAVARLFIPGCPPDAT